MTEQQRLSDAYNDLKEKHVALKSTMIVMSDKAAMLQIQLNKQKEYSDKLLKQIQSLNERLESGIDNAYVLPAERKEGEGYVTRKKYKKCYNEMLALCEKVRVANIMIERLKTKPCTEPSATTSRP